jgi:hypothetical protein
MAIHMVNGKQVDIPMESDGSVDSDVLREVAGIDEDRPLVLQRPDGRNEIINPGEKPVVRPGSHFRDVPVHQRGIGDRWSP